MTDKQHEKIEQRMAKAALKLQQYCEDYAGYCDCGDDGRPCVFWVAPDLERLVDGFCRLKAEPKEWFADTLVKEGK